jgi:RecA/RadA recombinase
MTQFLTEQPIVSEEGEPRRILARQLAEWIHRQPIGSEQKHPVPRGYVAGVYGARGSGKTSFLFTLLHEIRKEHEGSASLILPSSSDEHVRHAVFKPSDIRSQDGLLLMLLQHLERNYAGPSCSDSTGAHTGPAAEIRRNEILAKDLTSFLAYEKDIAPSSKHLRETHLQLHDDASTTTIAIQKSFCSFIEERKCDDRRLIVFIDDVDLQPSRALELLEILYLFLDLPGVFVILAADKPLLLYSIDQELKRRGTRKPGLASALLAKYVPYGWSLPLPNEAERFQMLSLSPPWSGGAAEQILKSAAQQPRPQRDHRDDDDDDDDWPPAPPEIILLEQAIRRFLPDTYRNIKALKNVLLSIEKNFSGDPVRFDDALAERYPDTGLRRELLPKFILLLHIIDVRWPDLHLLSAFERSGEDTLNALRSLYELGPWSLVPSDNDMAVLHALGAEPHSANDVRHPLYRLAEIHYSWRSLNAEAPSIDRVLFISFYGNADAPNTFRALWPDVLMDRVEHLDLRRFAPAGRPEGRQVRDAVMQAQEELPKLIGTTDRLWLGAEAPFSFLAWFGFWLDHRRLVVAANAKTLTLLEVPGKLDPPDRARIYAPCSLKWMADRTGSQHACVIFDFLGSSTPDDLGAFPLLTSESVGQEAPLRCRLVYSGGSDFNFDDVEAILLDVLELLTELRERGVATMHVGLIMPNVVAFALGRQLKSRGLTIVLYERMGATYERAIELE